MKPDPATTHYLRTALLVAWLVGGAALVVVNAVLGDLYHRKYRVELTFQFVNPTPEQEARRVFAEMILQAPWLSVVYAVATMYVFRRHGCLAVGWALAVVFGSVVVWSNP